MIKNKGKQFENDFKDSCKSEKIFYYRIKDTASAFNEKCFKCKDNKNKFTLKNECDFLIFHPPILIPIECKSISTKSISLSESMIKPQQIESLTKWTVFENVVPGFIFNFREINNDTYFLHINDFNNYIKDENRKNKASIPVAYCEKMGIKIDSMKKVKNYKYDVIELFDKLSVRYTN